MKPLCHFPGLGKKPSHTQPTCCRMPGLSLLTLRFPWGQDVPWSPRPVYYLLSAPACSSPFLGWPSALLLAPGSSQAPPSQQHPGLDPSDPSHLQLQHFYPDHVRVKTGLEEAIEATFFSAPDVGLKTFLVHIKEWEECDLKGAEDLTWHCSCHLVSQKKTS